MNLILITSRHLQSKPVIKLEECYNVGSRAEVITQVLAEGERVASLRIDGAD